MRSLHKDYLEGCDLPDPAGRALVTRNHDAEWPLLVIERLAVALVCQQDFAGREVRVNLCQRKDDLIAVGSLNQQACVNCGPFIFSLLSTPANFNTDDSGTPSNWAGVSWSFTLRETCGRAAICAADSVVGVPSARTTCKDWASAPGTNASAHTTTARRQRRSIGFLLRK